MTGKGNDEKKEWIYTISMMVFVLVRCGIGSITSPIMDCDETFNYIEPLHYILNADSPSSSLLNGKNEINNHFGFQTWEYSPLFALRSWFYVELHASPLKLLIKSFGDLIEFDKNKPLLFILLRVLIGMFCAIGESKLVVAVYKCISKMAGWITLFLLLLSPGIFHSGVAMLPSSSCMIAVMYSYSHWIPLVFPARDAEPSKKRDASEEDKENSSNAFYALMWGSFAVIICWPFCALMFVPMGLHVLIKCGLKPIIKTVVFALVLFGVIPGIVDSRYYDKITIPIINLILYNALGQGGGGKGADLYGVEPWTYYVRNLLLNLNGVAILGIVASPIIALIDLVTGFNQQNKNGGERYSFGLLLLPMFMTLGLFMSMAHKEERFLSMIYPVCAVSAAYILNFVYQLFKRSLNIEILGRFLVFVAVWFIALLSLSRIIAIVIGFSAPLNIFGRFYMEMAQRDQRLFSLSESKLTLCMGKEWYRFPSNFFIPKNVEVQWVKSSFGGLLPGHFGEYPKGLSAIPKYANDENKEEPRLYVDIDQCDYFADLLLPGESHLNSIERYKGNGSILSWKRVYCTDFLSIDESPSPWRSFYIPFGISNKKVVYRPYCILYPIRKPLREQITNDDDNNDQQEQE